MDDLCYKIMSNLLQEYCDDKPIVVMDLGSYDVNGTFKPLIKPNWTYIGVDIEQGPNVDIVMSSPYEIPLESNSIDLLISGNCIEHVKNPFRLLKEAVRILKPNCHAFIMAPFVLKVHRYPVDCWRFLPDGMDALFEESGLRPIKSHIVVQDDEPPPRKRYLTSGQQCYGVGVKTP